MPLTFYLSLFYSNITKQTTIYSIYIELFIYLFIGSALFLLLYFSEIIMNFLQSIFVVMVTSCVFESALSRSIRKDEDEKEDKIEHKIV